MWSGCGHKEEITDGAEFAQGVRGDGERRIPAGRRNVATLRQLPGESRASHCLVSWRRGHPAAPNDALGGLGELLGRGRRESKRPEFSSRPATGTERGAASIGALIDLEYRAHRADQVQSVRQQRHLSGYIWAATGRRAGAQDRGRRCGCRPNPNYRDVGGEGEQVCKGDLIRGRTLTGICNDILNPLMGSTGQLFARNVEFDSTFPDAGATSSRAIATATGWRCSSPTRR